MILKRKPILRYVLLGTVFAVMLAAVLALTSWLVPGFDIRRSLVNLGLNIPLVVALLFLTLHTLREGERQRVARAEQRQAEAERQAEEDRQQRAVAQLEAERYRFQLLKNQLDPHFLFNSLTSLTALVHDDPQLAERFTRELARVYRYLLRTSRLTTVDLRDELAFVRSYLYLEGIRTDGRLQVSEQVDDRLLEHQVIPGSVQTLCENALKHNANTEESPLRISIVADPEGVTVSNNLQPRRHRPDAAEASGIGLENLRLQYAMLEQQITVANDGHTYAVSLPFV